MALLSGVQSGVGGGTYVAEAGNVYLYVVRTNAQGVDWGRWKSIGKVDKTLSLQE